MKPDADNIEDAILVIEHAELSDRNVYNCSAENLATKYNSTRFPIAEDGAYVRVKGNKYQIRSLKLKLTIFV